MANPEKAWQFVLKNEDPKCTGAVTSEPNGGKARLGINSVAHPNAVSAKFFEMPLDQALYWAETCFKYDYFNMIGGYVIADQAVVNKYVDLAFNAGIREATLCVQRAVNSLRDSNKIDEDGKPGQCTLAAINATDPDVLLDAIMDQARAFYIQLAAHNQEKYKAYIRGWLLRVAVR